MLCEIGGTVGDIEGLPFFEAIRQFAQDKPRGQCIFMHLTLLPWIAASGELKTKPTQHSVKELRSIGIQPDVLVCRVDRPLPEEQRRKIALFTNVQEPAVIAAVDVVLLFALGLASASLALTFNDLARQVHQDVEGLGLLLAILILLVGHLLNLALAIMSGVVHGLRLNFIEFYNWALTGEGYPFRAFKKKELQE